MISRPQRELSAFPVASPKPEPRGIAASAVVEGAAPAAPTEAAEAISRAGASVLAAFRDPPGDAASRSEPSLDSRPGG